MACKGTLEVSVDALPTLLSHLPRGYRVVGSRDSRPDFVSLVLESEHISVDGGILGGMIEDNGRTRTVAILTIKA